ncbi:hypothetical protein MASR1M8_07340 [Thermomonas brevis]
MSPRPDTTATDNTANEGRHVGFEALIEKVSQAEQALEASERQTATRWDAFKATWRESWTPGRIVLAGLASGFIVGRAQPMRLAGSGGVLNLATALAGIFAGTGAHVAAKEAEDAANAAEGAAVAAVSDTAPPVQPTPAQFAAGVDHGA